MTPTNDGVAELLAVRAERADGERARAYRRAARAALSWPVEIGDVIAAGHAPSELPAIGPRLSGLIRAWVEEDAPVPDPPPARRGFISFAHALRVAGEHPEWEMPADHQMHTDYSDGKASILEMAEACAARGYAHAAVTDHSKGLKIAGGMDERRLAAQAREIEDVNGRLAGTGFTLLRAIEMNISPAGEGDMDPAALQDLDLVLGSFHSQLQTHDDQTERYLAAVRNPHVHVLGHPRGRIYNRRRGLTAEWGRVFEAAAAANTAIEIDCYPDRQDLDAPLARLAYECGAYLSIGTDAHNTAELAFMPVGIAIAVEAGVPRDRILNFMPRDALRDHVARA